MQTLAPPPPAHKGLTSFSGKRRRGRRAGGAVRAGKGLVGVVVAAAVWEGLRAVSVLPSASAPSIPAMLSAAIRDLAAGPLAAAAIETVYAWLVGMLVTVVVAVPLGALIGFSRWGDAALGLLFDFLRPIPAVALVPVSIVLLGLGLRMQTFLVAFASVWPLLFNTRYGVRNVDPLLLDSGRVMGLGRLLTPGRARSTRSSGSPPGLVSCHRRLTTGTLRRLLVPTMVGWNRPW